MDCKITSTSLAALGMRGLRAATLVETLVSVSIGGMVIAALCTLSFFSGRSFAAIGNYIELDAKSRNALDVMTKEIRQANALTNATPELLEFEDFDRSYLAYRYDSAAKALYRIKGGVTNKLLDGCDELFFGTFQRNPVGGTYDQYPTATPATTKLIQVTWTCSRQILGKTANTESVQSAKIVIRKQ